MVESSVVAEEAPVKVDTNSEVTAAAEDFLTPPTKPIGLRALSILAQGGALVGFVGTAFWFADHLPHTIQRHVDFNWALEIAAVAGGGLIGIGLNSLGYKNRKEAVPQEYTEDVFRAGGIVGFAGGALLCATLQAVAMSGVPF